MSTLRVDNIRSRTGTAVSITSGNSIIVGGGMTVTGDLAVTGSANLNAASGIATFATFVGALTGNVTGNVTGNTSGTAGNLTGNPNISVTNLTVAGDQTVGGAVTITGNLNVQGTQTIINTETYDVADKTVGIASTSTASNTTAAGAGIEIYASSSTANNNKTVLWQNTSNCFEFSESIKPKGVVETSINSGSTGVQTYIDGTSLVLEFDMESGTVFNYTSPTVAVAANAGGIGIVSFKNMPANAQCIQTVTLVHTQGKGTAGYGNTLPVMGMGATCTVIPKSGGSNQTGISTRAWVSGGIGAASTVTCTADAGTAGNVSGNVDIISFMVHYLGGTNTDLNQYKIYVTGNTGFNQGGHGV